ncbi:ribonuclease HII [Candidatus Kaiserbacteria bacterium]|nr:ribonuclease HII [Candidatus Kaiserbacteria bacterium]
MKKTAYSVGVDEAGRGPLAGPVAVGVVVVPKNFDWKCVPGVTDSKKLSEKNREAIFLRTQQLKKEQVLDYAVSLVSAATIDKKGITQAVRQGIDRGLRRLKLNPAETEIKLDGLLRAPSNYPHQETIVKGDQKERIIGLASILAKVIRDRHMVRLAKKYPEYGFEIHKGYGTEAHRTALAVHGLSVVHRASFCRTFS